MIGANKYHPWLARPRLDKKNTEPPDLTEITNVSREALAYAKEIGGRQQDFAEKQYAELAPMFKQLTESQIATQDQLNAQGKDYYDYQTGTFRPLEKSLVEDATNFSTDAYREQLAQKAAADAGTAFNATTEASNRSMAAMGVNPNSGRFKASTDRNNLQLAAIRAGTMTKARQDADQMGYARKLDAVGIGRNLPGASTAAYGVALNAGNSAGSNATTAGNQFMSGLNSAVNTVNSGTSQALNGLGTVANAQTSMYNNSGVDIGGILSGIGAIYKSDRRMKENIEQVGKDEATGLNLYEFNYIGIPDHRYRGVMADEVESKFPEAVVYDDFGFASVMYGRLGIEMKEVSHAS